MLGIAIVACEIDQSIIDRCYKSLVDSGTRIPYRVRIVRKRGSSFNLAKARNQAILELLPFCDKILCLDVDVLVPPLLLEHVEQQITDRQAVVGIVRNVDNFNGQYQWEVWRSLPLRNTGLGAFVGMTAADWLLTGGWDERCCGWGGEDNVLQQRRDELGIRTIQITEFPLVHIGHDHRPLFGARRGHRNLRIAGTRPSENWLTNRIPIPPNENYLHLFVTTDCQSSCPRCNQREIMAAHTGYQMPLDDLVALIDATQRSHYSPFRKVIISGGEPLLWKNLEKAIPLLREANLGPLHVFTNALAWEQLPRSIVDRVDQFRVSLYRWNQEQAQAFQKRYGTKVRIVDRQRHMRVPVGRYGLETLPAKCEGYGCVLWNGRVYPCCNAFSTARWLEGPQAKAPSCAIQPGYRELSLFNRRQIGDLCRGCIGNLNVRQWLGSD